MSTEAAKKRRWRKRHPEKNKELDEKTRHRHRFGSYVKWPECARCKATVKLLIHHRFFESCSACMPLNGRGICREELHLQTLCKTCHEAIHKRSEAISLSRDHGLQQELIRITEKSI